MIIQFVCLHGHEQDVFEHHRDDVGARTILCERCESSMGPVFARSLGVGLTAIEEGRPLVVENAQHDPITVHSWREYDKVLRDRGLAMAGQRRGVKGWWV